MIHYNFGWNTLIKQLLYVGPLKKIKEKIHYKVNFTVAFI